MLKRIYTRVHAPACVKACLLGLFLVLASVTTVMVAFPAHQANAAASSYLNFQGRLLTNTGAVVPDGNYNMEFKIYDTIASGASAQGVCSLNSSTDDCWWLETRTGGNVVRIVNGYFSVNLGSVTAFGASIPWDQQLYLTMRIGGTGAPSWDPEMLSSSNRMVLTGVPYAFRAGTLASFNGTQTGTLSFGAVTNSPVLTLPNETGTVCSTGSVCTGYAPSTLGTGYIQNGTSTQANANFNIQSAANGSVGGLIQGTAAQTADILKLVAPNNNPWALLINNTTFGSTDATGFGFYQENNGQGILGVNNNPKLVLGTNGNVGVGTTITADPAALLAVSGTGSTGSLFRVTDTTATSQNVLDIADGGAATFRNQTNSTAAFQIQNAGSASLFTVDTTNSLLTVGGHVLPSVIATSGSTSDVITTHDSAQDVSQEIAVSIAPDGLPVMAYYESPTDLNLQVVKCSNATCTSSTSTTVYSTNDAGNSPSITIGTDGLPIIAYGVSGDLYVTKCNNAACTSSSTNLADAGGANDVGWYTSIAVPADGLPLISYKDYSANDLRVTKCGNTSCSSGNTSTSFDGASNTGNDTSLAIGTDGLGIIVYTLVVVGNNEQKVAHCDNTNCTTTTITVVDNGSETAGGISPRRIAIGADGLPVFAYQNGTLDLVMAKCSTVTCSSSSTVTVDSTSSADLASSVGVAIGSDGLPIIAYRDTAGTRLRTAKCATANCSSATLTSVDSSSNVGQGSQVAIGSDSLPFIAYRDVTATSLKTLRCGDTDCSGSGTGISGGINLGSSASYFQNLYVQNISSPSDFTSLTLATNGIQRASIDAAGTFTLQNGSSGSFLNVKHLSTNFGTLATGGAFADLNSYYGEEFNEATGASSTADAANFGDNLTWYGDTTSALWTMSQTARLNGTLRAVSTNTAAAGLSFAYGNVGNTPDKIWATNNLPVAQIKFMTNNSAGTTNDYYIGLTNAGAATATDNTLPTDGVYFTNNNTGSWVGQVRQSSSTTGTTSACGTISTTAFAIMRIEVVTSSSVRFLLDPDVSDGVNLVDCGTITGTLSGATLLGANVNVTQVDTAQDPTIDIDYFRVWQDDAPILTVDANDSLGIGSPISNQDQTAGQELLNNTASTDTFQFANNVSITTTYGAHDITEDFSTRDQDLTSGSLVSVDPSETGFVRRTQTSKDNAVLGIYSENPGLRLSQQSEAIDGVQSVPVAFAGRLQVNVTNENGPISPGDYLTSSSTPGYAMKASETGSTIGKALAYFNKPSGKVLTYVNVSYYTPSMTDRLQGSVQRPDSALQGGLAINGDINITGTAQFNLLTADGDANFRGNVVITGTLKTQSIETSGHIITAGDTPQIEILPAAGQAAIATVEGNDVSGTIHLTSGIDQIQPGNMAKLTFKKSYSKIPKVFIEAANPDAITVQIYRDVTPDNFVIRILNQLDPGKSYEFDYFVVE